MNTRNIKFLVDIMEKSSLTALEIEEEDCKIRLERNAGCGAPAVAAPVVQTVAAAPAVVAAPIPQPVQEAQPQAPQASEGRELKAPMVGVFYASSSPEADPYVRVGSQVKKGDVLCIIEAMKLMNEITAEFDGEVIEICAQNGQIVEYGQPLFRLK